jgi:hypothetical protein
MDSQHVRFEHFGRCVLAAILMVTAESSALCASQILKFSQLPMLDTPLADDLGLVHGYHGHDELSTAWTDYGDRGDPLRRSFQGALMADDFADSFSSPVVKLRWWGSYLNGPLQGVDKFLVAFSSDVPAAAGAGSFSHPGPALASQVVTRGALAPGSGTFTEQQVYPLSVDGPIYEYNAELNLGQEFHQQPNTVYWLTIAALVDVLPNTNPLTDPRVIRWGWHNRDFTIKDTLASTPPAVSPGEHIAGQLNPNTNIWHFQDDAVSGDLNVSLRAQPGGGVQSKIFESRFVPQNYQSFADGPRAIGRYSKDLAFELYTAVPEPSACLLIATGLCGVLIRSRNRSAAQSTIV